MPYGDQEPRPTRGGPAAGNSAVGILGSATEDFGARRRILAGSTRNAVALGLGGEHFSQFGNILAAAHGEVGLAAAFAAELGAEFADELASLLAALDRGG